MGGEPPKPPGPGQPASLRSSPGSVAPAPKFRTTRRRLCPRPQPATSHGDALELMVPARPVLSESCPQSLGVFSVTQAHQVSVCLLLGHLAFGDGALHVHSGMPSADVANRCVEVGGTFCGSESLCFFFGDPTRSHHFVHLLDDAFPFFLCRCLLGVLWLSPVINVLPVRPGSASISAPADWRGALGRLKTAWRSGPSRSRPVSHRA